ncbi:MAG: VOC family protein [Bauldia sp.]
MDQHERRDGHPFLWISTSAAPVQHVHLALRAESRAQVDAFYAAAMAAGGTDNGPPGLRPQYSAHYYAAYVLDPDGHNIEAVTHGDPKAAPAKPARARRTAKAAAKPTRTARKPAKRAAAKKVAAKPARKVAKPARGAKKPAAKKPAAKKTAARRKPAARKTAR